jgi:type IX secretion system PorP/SprF family membrane protein
MKNIILAIILCVCIYKVNAQQIPNASFIPATRAILNPAYTATGNDFQIDGFFRAQWLGFSGAPVSGFVAAQYPFLKQNMSAGGFIHFDNAGPVSKIGFQGNYAYKLKEVIGRRDFLQLGLSVNLYQYKFSGASQVVNEINDPYLTGTQSAFNPALGIGAYYQSTNREYKENMFFVGLSSSQVFSTDLLINDADQSRVRHFHANVGGRFYSYDSYIEPMVSANLVQPDIINVLYGLRYEKDETFWAGIGYESAGLAAFQGGVILTNLGEDEDGTMRLGALANYGVSSRVSQVGPSLEFYLSYSISK